MDSINHYLKQQGFDPNIIDPFVLKMNNEIYLKQLERLLLLINDPYLPFILPNIETIKKPIYIRFNTIPGYFTLIFRCSKCIKIKISTDTFDDYLSMAYSMAQLVVRDGADIQQLWHLVSLFLLNKNDKFDDIHNLLYFLLNVDTEIINRLINIKQQFPKLIPLFIAINDLSLIDLIDKYGIDLNNEIANIDSDMQIDYLLTILLVPKHLWTQFVILDRQMPLCYFPDSAIIGNIIFRCGNLIQSKPVREWNYSMMDLYLITNKIAF